jgi:hypothetical protein
MEKEQKRVNRLPEAPVKVLTPPKRAIPPKGLALIVHWKLILDMNFGGNTQTITTLTLKKKCTVYLRFKFNLESGIFTLCVGAVAESSVARVEGAGGKRKRMMGNLVGRWLLSDTSSFFLCNFLLTVQERNACWRRQERTCHRGWRSSGPQCPLCVQPPPSPKETLGVKLIPLFSRAAHWLEA